MKKVLLIIAIVLLLLLLGLWAYLLMYGRPESLPWGNADFAPEAAPVSESSFSDVPDTPVETTTTIPLDGLLVELSSRPTAGATIFTRDGSEYVRYVERGTGHIFEVDLQSGSTERISNTTIPRVTGAVWNNSGTRVVLIYEASVGTPESVIGTLQRTDSGSLSLETAPLPPRASNIAFVSSGDALYYTAPNTAGAAGYRRDLKTNTETMLFSLPLREIAMVWDPAGNEHYVSPKPTAVMSGNLYRIDDGALTSVGIEAAGLMVRRLGDSRFLIGSHGAPGVDLALYDTDAETLTPATIKGFPEKCAAVATTTLWCLAPLTAPSDVYPDAWYQGAVSFTDYMWRADQSSLQFAEALNLETAAQTPLDGIDPLLNQGGTRLIFINKRDGTLWLANLDRLTTAN